MAFYNRARDPSAIDPRNAGSSAWSQIVTFIAAAAVIVALLGFLYLHITAQPTTLSEVNPGPSVSQPAPVPAPNQTAPPAPTPSP